MAEVTRRRLGELVRGVFQVLEPEIDGLPAHEVLRRVETVVPPTPFENSNYPKNPHLRRYEKTVRFSTIGPVKAGWLLKSKGRWTLTEEGRAALQTFPDPEALMKESNRLYGEWKKAQPETSIDEGEEQQSVDASTTLEESEEAAWSEIGQYLRNMPPYDFQDLVAALLRGMGYHVSWVAPPGPDRGLDIIASTDPLGAKGPRIKVQVKRRGEKTTADGLRSFMALLGEQDVGLYVSTGGFTSDAEVEARMQEKRKIVLVDLERLFDMWVEHYSGIPEDERQLLPLKAVHFLLPRP